MYDIRVFFTEDGFLGMPTTESFDQMWSLTEGRHRVDRVVFHPMYDHDRFHYDIAVLHLANPQNTITPISLASCHRQ